MKPRVKHGALLETIAAGADVVLRWTGGERSWVLPTRPETGSCFLDVVHTCVQLAWPAGYHFARTSCRPSIQVARLAGVGPLVPGSIAIVVEVHRAPRASVRLLARVAPLVPGNGALVCEAF